MQPLPHLYSTRATATTTGEVRLAVAGAPTLICNAPAEFGGPGDQWSPESLLVASVASCFVLTFRALARAARLDWTSLECSSEGTLERLEGKTRFTRMLTTARLSVPAVADQAACVRILEKSERDCLIANSLSAQRELKVEVVVG